LCYPGNFILGFLAICPTKLVEPECGANLVEQNRENITVDALIEKQRRLARSKNPCERVVGSLCVAAILKKQLVGLPNSTIGRLMTDYICSEQNLLGPESVIVEIASERLRESGVAMVPRATRVEKYETSQVCPECGAKFWRVDE
jgi:hypothetical protein